MLLYACAKITVVNGLADVEPPDLDPMYGIAPSSMSDGARIFVFSQSSQPRVPQVIGTNPLQKTQSRPTCRRATRPVGFLVSAVAARAGRIVALQRDHSRLYHLSRGRDLLRRRGLLRSRSVVFYPGLDSDRGTWGVAEHRRKDLPSHVCRSDLRIFRQRRRNWKHKSPSDHKDRQDRE